MTISWFGSEILMFDWHINENLFSSILSTNDSEQERKRIQQRILFVVIDTGCSQLSCNKVPGFSLRAKMSTPIAAAWHLASWRHSIVLTQWDRTSDGKTEMRKRRDETRRDEEADGTGKTIKETWRCSALLGAN